MCFFQRYDKPELATVCPRRITNGRITDGRITDGRIDVQKNKVDGDKTLISWLDGRVVM